MQPHEDLAQAAPDTWPAGKMISGTWTIEGRLGQGSFGAAYLVSHRFLTRRKAVIKRLDERHSHDRAFVKSFLDEASIMDALSDCPQVVQPWDVNRSEDHFIYICMEYMPGGSLAGVLERQEKNRLDPASALDITRQMLIALESAHAANIFHLDIKPDNILLKSAGAPWIAKLADFGISYRIAESAGPASSNFRGAGSAGYIPLEQVTGKRRDLDARADLYALGMTLFRMLTGRFAFHFDNWTEWPILVKGSEPPPPSRFVPELAKWPGLDAFVLKLIAREREGRFESAVKAREALLDLKPVPVRTPTVPDPQRLAPVVSTPESPTRRTALIGALGAIPVVAGCGYWLGQSGGGSGSAAEDRAAVEKSTEAAVYGHMSAGRKAEALAEVRKLRAKFADSAVASRLEKEIGEAPSGGSTP